MGEIISMRKQNTRKIGLVLDFVTDLSSAMIVAGANIERVELAIYRILEAYGLRDISVFLLTTDIIVSARSESGKYTSRQRHIPPSDMHLERLKRLNRMSFRIVRDRPDPEELSGILEHTLHVKEYPEIVQVGGRLAAMACTCHIFGGGVPDMLCVMALTVILYYLQKLLTRPSIDKVLTNAISMFVCSSLAIFLCAIGFGENYVVIVITNCMLMMPGIPLVNAVRNILCNNELNGILQFLKVLLEVVAIAVGIVASVRCFGHFLIT